MKGVDTRVKGLPPLVLEPCPDCGGAGYLYRDNPGPRGFADMWTDDVECQTCHGTGEVEAEG